MPFATTAASFEPSAFVPLAHLATAAVFNLSRGFDLPL
jgi:hypothetical protein